MIWNIIGTWIAAGLTLAIFSFLYKDNPFYKFAEHLYVGVSAGFGVIYVWAFDLKPMLIDRFLSETGVERWILIVPAILGILMLTRWFGKIGYLSRLPIAFTVGIGAGLGITASVQGFLLPQIQATLLPLTTINNIILVVGVITTILYFYFSREFKGKSQLILKLGIIFIMISFGASFGYTVMARISLLIGRIFFLLSDWLHII
ncbi:MAG: hypothetical protein ABIK33_05880 [candidate division WOR-3 bacterium]